MGSGGGWTINGTTPSRPVSPAFIYAVVTRSVRVVDFILLLLLRLDCGASYICQAIPRERRRSRPGFRGSLHGHGRAV